MIDVVRAHKFPLDVTGHSCYVYGIGTQEAEMTKEAQKAKILATIEVRGWSLAELFFAAGRELQAEGKVKMADRYFTGGNRKNVWVAA